MAEVPLGATAGESLPPSRSEPRGRTLAPADLALFSELLAGLLDANLPLPEALRSLSQDAQSGALRKALAQVQEDVTGGVPFAEALRRRNGVFPELFVRVAEQGQAANNLPAALVEMVREYRSQARFREALWSQLVGPWVFKPPGGAFGLAAYQPRPAYCAGLAAREALPAQEWGQDFQTTLGQPVSQPILGATLQ
ncbi:MAG: type II secretion system F family protein [Planctomycetota bacterium]